MLTILTDNRGPLERALRATTDAIGIDPYDVDLDDLLDEAAATEAPPVSRFRWGSPCRFVRAIDVAVHVVLPGMLEEAFPVWACYLRSTSPRWGRRWRSWS